MIDLYYWPTPNGRRVSIMLEECGLEYKTHRVNIDKGDQFDPAYSAISPNNKIPAIVDQDTDGAPLPLFESGAILWYLAEKTGRFLPTDRRQRLAVMQWLFWMSSGLGPSAGQLAHFMLNAAEEVPYAEERYTKEYERLLAVLDKRLEGRDFLAADAYSIADIGSWTWVMPAARGRLGVTLEAYPQVRRWFGALKARAAVTKGAALGSDW